MRTKSIFPLCLAILAVSGAGICLADEMHEKVNSPGFRPKSELADTFLRDIGSSRIAVLPAVIRTKTSTRTSEAPQKAAVSFLSKRKLGIAEARKLDLEMGEIKGKGQFEWFQNDQAKLGGIAKSQSGADYYLTLEYLVPKTPSGDIVVFGIHVYVLDADGENAFSFLLNSHHKMLVDAGLKSADSSAQGYEALVDKATSVALDALSEQIKQAGNKESP